MRRDLVGRAADLEAATAALEEHRVLALTGTTGVGKSRLLDELLDRVQRPDRPVFRAVGTAATRTVPLGPFVALAPTVPTQDRSVLLHGLLGALRARGGRDGLVVAVDDAHHLDDATLALLAVLDDEDDIDLAISISADQPLADGLRAVLDRDRTARIDLAPLDRDDADALVVTSIGPTGAELLHDIWNLAAGNPLVIRELLAGAKDRLRIGADGDQTLDGDLGSGRLRELVRDRLDHLPEAVRRPLGLVAVGSPLPYELLSTAVSGPELSALHDADVVETVRTGDELVVRPTHPLYGELYAMSAGETRRREALRRLVECAIETPGVVDPLRVALWHEATGDPPDASIRFLGARAALSRHDGALAEALLLPVIDRLDQPAEIATMGMALVQQGRPGEAEDFFASAAQQTTTAEETTEVASARAFNLAFGLGRVDEAESVLSSASATVEGVPRSRLDAERGVIAAISGDFALASSAALATIANDDAAGPALASAYVSRTLAEAMLGRCDGIERTAALGVEFAGESAEELPFARDQIRIMEANALIGAGRIDAADEVARGEVAGPTASPATATPWLGTRCIALGCAGRLHEATALAERSLRSARQLDPFGLVAQAEGILSLVRGLQGYRSERRELEELREANDEPRSAVWIDRALAWERVTAGKVDDGARIVTEGGLAAIDRQHVMWGVMALHDAVRLGHADAVADHLTAAVAATTGADLLVTMARHARALSDGSARALSEVADEFASHGAWLLAAEAGAQAAAVSDIEGERPAAARAAAISMLREARCQGPATPALAGRPAIVTPRELEIASDAATGTSSAEISDRRFISVRTVDNHLGRVYRSLGIGGRDELAAVLGPHVAPG